MTDDELRDAIVRIDERTKTMAVTFETIDKRLDSHAGKIRELERWRFLLGGAIAAVGAMLKLSK